jgi:PAS domain S-box-containing protein
MGFVNVNERNSRNSIRLGAEHYRLIVESATDMAIVAMDLDRKIVSWNPGAERLLGYIEDEIVGESADVIFVEEDCATGQPQRECQKAIRDGSSEDERWHKRKDGSRFWGSGLMMPLRDEGGQIIGLMKLFRDRTRQHEQEETNNLLQRELNHRIKNILSMVQALSHSLLRSNDTIGGFREAFTHRLLALSRAHDLLSSGEWRGAGLADLLDRTLEPYSGTAGRVTVQGPLVTLQPNTAIALHLVFHELATNAAKYGAASNDGGCIYVTWKLQRDAGQDWVEVEWREEDGPPVTPPETHGFGSQLIDQSVQQIGGVSRIHYRSFGVICTLRFPLKVPATDTL